MKKLLPIVLLFVGLGAGVGAGVFLRPEPGAVVADVGTPTEHGDAVADHVANEDVHAESVDHDEAPHEEEPDGHGDEAGGNEYAKLNNQFVVPIVGGDKVVALVVLALSIEVPNGKVETVFQREPKLRDSFLQVLFDHANIGGFEGNFTDAQMLGRLREALNEVAQRDLGKKVALDVLIEEIARQDY